MNQRTITCPFCASQVSGDSTICPGCQEDLAALAHLEYADMIHYNQALAMAKEGRLREAREELSEALTANHSFGSAFALLAKVNVHEGDWEHAKSNVKKALSLMPSDDAVVKLADDIVNAAPALSPRETAVQAPLPPDEELTIPQTSIGELEQAEADQPNAEEQAQAIKPAPEEYIPEPKQPARLTLSSKSRLITEHADTDDIASLSAPLPWVARAETASARAKQAPRTVQESAPSDASPAADPEQAADQEYDAPPTPSQPKEERQPEREQPSLGSVGALLPQDPILRTVGMGILITMGLAFIIRTLSGED